jgi:predicted 2-oxoglutarate/Fe(II)-dependent dioxygenase YbiX
LLPNNVKVYPNFVPADVCDAAIVFIKENKEKGLFKKANLNCYHYTNNVNDMSAKLINTQASRVLVEYLGELPSPLWITDQLFSLYCAGSSLSEHRDTDTLYAKVLPYNLYTFVLYFNDDFEGGEIYFSEFDFTVKPEKGTAVMFPGTNLHEVKEITQGERYSFTGGFTDNPKVHLFDYPFPSQN